jgi:hypothetical protein
LAPVVRLIPTPLQRMLVKALVHTDRVSGDSALVLSKALASELGLKGVEEDLQKPPPSMSPEMERQMAWERIKDLITERAGPEALAAAIRGRLHQKYDADELKQSWVTLLDADVITLIRTFCQLPYLADGKTDPIARTVLESYVTRLTHEKYVATYQKVVTSLRNMFAANPHSPTLQNFLALVRWVDATAADQLNRDVGISAAA